jgi:hypothetical protein
MHKYEEQSVPYGGTDAQGISDSIHTRHLVCLFDVAVQSRCMKMYAMQSLERSSRRITSALVTPERRRTAGCRRSVGTNRSREQSRRRSPKNLIAHTPVQVYLCRRRFRRPALPLYLCSQKMGRECVVYNSCKRCYYSRRALTSPFL